MFSDYTRKVPSFSGYEIKNEWKMSKKAQEKSLVIKDKKVGGATGLQKNRLERLMNDPDKPVHIPQKRESKLKDPDALGEYVRNVMGSSAGAGSGDFHIYRGIRRRENQREGFRRAMAEKEKSTNEFNEWLDTTRSAEAAKTAKKAAKRKRLKEAKKLAKEELKEAGEKKKAKTTDSAAKADNEEEEDEAANDDEDQEEEK